MVGGTEAGISFSASSAISMKGITNINWNNLINKNDGYDIFFICTLGDIKDVFDMEMRLNVLPLEFLMESAGE